MAETLKIKDLPIDDRPREAFMRSAKLVDAWRRARLYSFANETKSK